MNDKLDGLSNKKKAIRFDLDFFDAVIRKIKYPAN